MLELSSIKTNATEKKTINTNVVKKQFGEKNTCTNDSSISCHQQNGKNHNEVISNEQASSRCNETRYADPRGPDALVMTKRSTLATNDHCLQVTAAVI